MGESDIVLFITCSIIVFVVTFIYNLFFTEQKCSSFGKKIFRALFLSIVFGMPIISFFVLVIFIIMGILALFGILMEYLEI